jgi:hypothetical protein
VQKLYITKLIHDLDFKIYTLVNLLEIDRTNNKTKLLDYNKRTIICATDIKGEIYTLNLNKVQYLFNCEINIFRGRKLLKRDNIRIINYNLIINREK